MRIHCLQHVAFEGPGNIAAWAQARGHHLTFTRFYEGDLLPALEGIDLLVVMGGPMNIDEESEHPWLAGEKAFIRSALGSSLHIIGICLGAQLIANVLGQVIRKNREPEIGWLPIEWTEEAKALAPFRDVTTELVPFHWHFDTFDAPPGSLPLAYSDRCANQGFVIGTRVIGFQFHPEIDRDSVAQMIEHCPDDLKARPYIQTAEEMLAREDLLAASRKFLFGFLDNFCLMTTLNELPNA